MKTIATAAVLLMLSLPAWADEAENEQANEPANTNDPIVLSEVQMDGVIAGAATDIAIIGDFNSYEFTSPNTTTTSGDNVGVLLRGIKREEVSR